MLTRQQIRQLGFTGKGCLAFFFKKKERQYLLPFFYRLSIFKGHRRLTNTNQVRASGVVVCVLD